MYIQTCTQHAKHKTSLAKVD